KFEDIAERYPRWLDQALHRRLVILGVAAAAVAGAFMLIPTIGFSWMPDTNANEFNVGYRVPPGSRLEYTKEKGREIAAFLKSIPEVAHTQLSVGGGFQGTPNGGRILIILKDSRERTRTLAEIQNSLRVELRKIPGVRPSITGQRTVFGGGYRQPIIVN